MAELDPNHEGKRTTMSGAGLVLLVLGVPCGLIGLVLFMSGFFTPTSEFFANPHGVMDRDGSNAAIGMVMMAAGGFATVIGLNLLGFANRGKIARYQAGELLPVAKDVVRDVQPVVREVARDLAGAVREGLTGSGDAAGRVRHACGTYNDADDRFCKGCGRPLRALHCPTCGSVNDPDARFCDKCGREVGR